MDLPLAPDTESRMETAERLIAGGQWDRALPLLQGLIDENAGLAWDGRAYVPVRTLVTRRVAALAPEVRQLYGALYDAAAGRLLADGLAGRSEAKLREAAARYLNTDAGLRALGALAAVRMDAGEFEAALLLLRTPDRLPLQVPAGRAMAVRELLCLAWLGRRGEAEELLGTLRQEGLDSIEIQGTERAIRDLLDEAIARSVGRPPVKTPEVLPSPAAGVPTPSLAAEGLYPVSVGLSWPGQVKPDWPSIPSTLPVAGGNHVYVNRDGAVIAVDLTAARPRWVALSPGAMFEIARTIPARGRLDTDLLPLYLPVENVHHWSVFDNHGMSTLRFADSRLYAVQMDPLRQQFPEQPWAGTQDHLLLANELHCYDAQTGDLVWTTGEGTKGTGALPDRWFLTAPEVHAGRAYALSVRKGELRAVCLQAASGRLLWDAPVGSIAGRQEAQRYSMEFFLADANPPAVCRGVAVYPTGRGVVSAFDAYDGRPLWTAAYPRADVWISRLGEHLNVPNGPWVSAPPIVSGDLCLIAPTDSRHVLALSLATGGVVWQASFPDGEALLGALDGKLYVQHEGVTCIDIASGRSVWETGFDAPCTGVGALGTDVVYIPQREGLRRVDAATGRALRPLEWPPGTEGNGNLLLLPDALVMCAPERLVIFRALDEALKAAEARLAVADDRAEALLLSGTLKALRGDTAAVAELEAAANSIQAGAPGAAASARQATRALLGLAARSGDLRIIERAAAIAPAEDEVQAELAVARLRLALAGSAAQDASAVYLSLCRSSGMRQHAGRYGSASVWTHLAELVRAHCAERAGRLDDWRQAMLTAVDRAAGDADEAALIELAHWAPFEPAQSAARLRLARLWEQRGRTAKARRAYAALIVRHADAEEVPAAREGVARALEASGRQDAAADYISLLTTSAQTAQLEHVPAAETAWSVPGNLVLPERRGPAWLPGRLLVLQKTELRCVDIVTGERLWGVSLPGGEPAGPAPSPAGLPSRWTGWGCPACLLGPSPVTVALPDLMLGVDAAAGQVTWTRDAPTVLVPPNLPPLPRLKVIRWALRGLPVPPESTRVVPEPEQPGAWSGLLAFRIEEPGVATVMDPFDGEVLFRYGTERGREWTRAGTGRQAGVRGALLAVAGSRFCVARDEPPVLSVLDGDGGRLLAEWRLPASPGKRSLTATTAGNVVLADTADVFLFDLTRMRLVGRWRVTDGVSEVLHADDDWILLRTLRDCPSAIPVHGGPAQDLGATGAGRALWAARRGETACLLEASEVLGTLRYGPDRHFVGSGFALRSVRLPDGATLWRAPLQAAPGAIVSEPVPCGSLWLLTIAEEGRARLIGIDAAAGGVLFTVELETEGAQAPVPFVVADGRVVLGVGDKVVALRPSETPASPAHESQAAP